MEVGRIVTSGLKGIDAGQFKSGERLLVEIVQISGEGQGTIRIKGQDFLTLFEIPSKLGEKFWVKVGDLKDGSIQLIREPLQETQTDSHEIPQEFLQLHQRGLPINKEIKTFLEAFFTDTTDILGSVLEDKEEKYPEEIKESMGKDIPQSKGLAGEKGAEIIGSVIDDKEEKYPEEIKESLRKDIPQSKGLAGEKGAEIIGSVIDGKEEKYPEQIKDSLRKDIPESKGLAGEKGAEIIGSVIDGKEEKYPEQIKESLRNAIPEWSDLSGEKGVEILVEGLRKLGLNYEQRILQMLKLDGTAKEIEKNNLKETLKYKILEAIQNQEEQHNNDPKEPLNRLLQKITGQQLWFKTGALDNAFMLLHLILINHSQPVPIKIAMESARKGARMDEQHCRVAVQLETPELGAIGIDAYFNEDSLYIQVLTRNHGVLPQLIEEVMPQTRLEFAKLGFKLAKVETGDLDKNIEFQNFLQGNQRSGVDIQG